MHAVRLARAGALLGLSLVLLSACGGEPNMMHTERGRYTPDEFAVLPSKPIEIPNDLRALPEPTPAGTPNRTDVTPEADAVAALGGSPSQVYQDGRLGADGQLVTHTSRYGTDPQIRTELASEDLQYRQRHRGRLMERIFGVPTYYSAYDGLSLDQYEALEKARQSGLPTPAVPTDPALD